jgi:S-adenosylmethionine hydrolase
MTRVIWFVFLFCSCIGCRTEVQKPAIVFQTDFGLKDGAVSAMKGVAHEVDPSLQLFDLTHEIPAYDIWEASYRLFQTAAYWPRGTVFVSVVDPGVGTKRKSVVVLSRSGHYFVGPDNGSFTLISESLGIESVREINEEINRRENSSGSYTFHGRDVYAYTAARLASGQIRFEEVGNELPAKVETIHYQQALLKGDSILGNIPVLDIQYGNVWTNINDSLFGAIHIKAGDSVELSISDPEAERYRAVVPFANTFGDVAPGAALGYLNSLMNFSVAINEGNFADSFKIKSGAGWRVSLKKHKSQ